MSVDPESWAPPEGFAEVARAARGAGFAPAARARLRGRIGRGGPGGGVPAALGATGALLCVAALVAVSIAAAEGGPARAAPRPARIAVALYAPPPDVPVTVVAPPRADVAAASVTTPAPLHRTVRALAVPADAPQLAPPPPGDATAPSPPPAAPPATEVELLVRAHRELVPHPAAALDTLAQLAELYPRGAFAEERDAMRVEATLRAGDASRALTLERAFLAAYPTSAHRAHLDDLYASLRDNARRPTP